MKDELYLRKLIADGEGTGEVRRFEIVLSCIRNMRQNGNSPVEASRCLRLIEAMELSVKKQEYIAACCSKQCDEYKESADEIDREILASKDLMEKAKNDLAAARHVRKNRQEYAELVRKIEEMPSREATTTRLTDIHEDLKNQHERQRLLELKIAERRNHLHAFNAILEKFQAFIANDEELFADSNGDEMMDTECSPNDD